MVTKEIKSTSSDNDTIPIKDLPNQFLPNKTLDKCKVIAVEVVGKSLKFLETLHYSIGLIVLAQPSNFITPQDLVY